MAQLQIKGPFRKVPQSSQDLEKFFRDVVSVKESSIETADMANDSVTTTKVANKAITLQKLADLTADRIVGRLATDGEAQQLTPENVRDLLQVVAWIFAEAVQFSQSVQIDGDVGFYGATPVAQQAGPSAPSISAVSGTSDDSTINANFSALEGVVNDLRTVLDNLNLTT